MLIINPKVDRVRLIWVELWDDWEYEYHVYEDDVLRGDEVVHRKTDYTQGHKYPDPRYILDKGVTLPLEREPKSQGILICKQPSLSSKES